MKRIILFSLAILYFNANAQTNNCEEKVNNLFINKVKAYDSKDLIPYWDKKSDKWGYFHRNTKKILTSPIMDGAYFFNPHINFSYSFEQKGKDGCSGKIYGSKIDYRLVRITESVYELSQMVVPREATPNYKQFIKPEISGFEVNVKGELTYFNPKYYDEQNDEPRIINVFKANGANYAIMKVKIFNRYYYSVINQQGEMVKNFENLKTYPIKKQSYNNEKDIWFWVEVAEKKYIFRSLLTGQRLTETFDYSPNWENNAQSFGYGIFAIGKQKGLLDLTTMEWKIKPSIKNDFSTLVYASSESLSYNYDKNEFSYNPSITASLSMIQANRKNAYIYLENNKGEFMDLDLKLYKPIK